MALTRRPALIKVAVAALMIIRCSSSETSGERTEVIVVVDTDFDIPAELDAIVIEVTSPTDEVQFAAKAFESSDELPATLGLLHEDGPLGPFGVRVIGSRSGEDLLERQATFRFVEGRTLVLTMHLLRACRDVDCSVDQTCVDGHCVDVEVNEDDLEAWTGTPPRLDSTTPDGDADVDTDVDGDGDADVDADVDGDADMDGDLETDADVDECIEELCNGLDDDCDGRIDEDFDLDSDEDNCGVCGQICSFPNGTGQCRRGECVLSECDEDHDDCNETADDGCEADLDDDVDNCGTCGNHCRGRDRFCCSGDCRRDCD